eukprot:m.24183 g.24183  ORF g.24183 m.24183 type:complete len:217 (-) comp8638_c1_seq1:35-685(-)
MSSEKQPLHGGEFLPPRASSGRGIQDLETYTFFAIVLMGIAAGVLCIVYTISHHPEHMAGAIAVFVNLALLLLVGRAYRRDEIQDRKIIYLVTFSSLMLYIMAIIYVAQWGPNCTGSAPAASPFPSNCPVTGATAFYSPFVRNPNQPGVGTCLAFQRINPVYPCYLINTSITSRFNATGIDNTGYVTQNSFGVAEATKVYQACFQRAGVKNTLPNP